MELDMKKKILYASLVGVTLLLILNPQRSVMYAQNAMELCGSVIVPSLFPFFVCSGLLIYSGFCELLAKAMQPVMKPMFNVNGSGAAAFVLGIISGYPLGAVTACRLYEKNYLSKTETERLLAFCNNSGPLFILGAVGISMYHNPRIGIALYAAHILSAILTGLLFRFYRKNDFNAPAAELGVEEKSFSEMFSAVLANSLQSILIVCGAVVFFSVISSIIIDFIPLSENIKAAVAGIFEFATGIKAVAGASMPLLEKLVISAGVVGFAGISVHIQVMSVAAGRGLSLVPYIVGKAVQGIISMILVFVILRLVPIETAVFSLSAVEVGGAFAMDSLFVIMTVTSVFFVALGGTVFAIFKKRAEKSCQG